MTQTKSEWVDFKDIKARVSIVHILERYEVLTSLSKSGNGDRLSGACPIHGGTNKTHFRVSVSKNCWNCFGTCRSGGNVIDFVAKKENIGFREAALLIGEWFPEVENNGFKQRDQIPKSCIAEDAPRSRSAERRREGLPQEAESETPNKPLGFALQHLDSGHPYLSERRLSVAAIAEFGLGYCQKGSMTGRIVIPIHNLEGQLVAYAGRWPGTPSDKDTPKYKLPPGFRKAREIFNAHRAFAESDASPLVIVEGFFACIALWQHGIRRVVALMGSSLSPHQEKLIAAAINSQSRIILMLDEDDAGKAASDEIAARLSKLCFIKTFVFGEVNMQPENLSADALEEIRGGLP